MQLGFLSPEALTNRGEFWYNAVHQSDKHLAAKGLPGLIDRGKKNWEVMGTAYRIIDGYEG